MTWDPRPVPEPSPETAPYWEAATDGELLLAACPDCGLVFHYPRALCPDCFADTEWRPADGTGTIYSYSAAESVAGWPEEHLPLVVAYVELAEGPRIVSTIMDADPTELAVGTPVAVDFVPTDRGDVAIPVFVPVDE